MISEAKIIRGCSVNQSLLMGAGIILNPKGKRIGFSGVQFQGLGKSLSWRIEEVQVPVVQFEIR